MYGNYVEVAGRCHCLGSYHRVGRQLSEQPLCGCASRVCATIVCAGRTKNGLEFTAAYGYVGIAVELEDFVADGLNEAGLAAGLFYFPHYGSYEAYDEGQRESTLSDLQLVPWMLSQFKTVDEVKEALGAVHVVSSDPRASTLIGALRTLRDDRSCWRLWTAFLIFMKMN